MEMVSAGCGYFSEEAVKQKELGEAAGRVVYCAVEKQSHHRAEKKLEKREKTGRRLKRRMERRYTKSGKRRRNRYSG
ncbi:MAG: hypothetical protein LBG27_13585 [Spirochaetaceae bacterium]|nr:hypothetical protein [Spirochaetaceae bacterium]